jgi:hypothetical protein
MTSVGAMPSPDRQAWKLIINQPHRRPEKRVAFCVDDITPRRGIRVVA